MHDSGGVGDGEAFCDFGTELDRIALELRVKFAIGADTEGMQRRMIRLPPTQILEQLLERIPTQNRHGVQDLAAVVFLDREEGL